MAERNIDGVGECRCAPLPALKAIGLFCDVMRRAGPAISRVPALTVGFRSDDGVLIAAAQLQAMQALVDVIAVTPSDEIVSLIRRLVETVEVRQPSGTYRRFDLDGDATGQLPILIPVAIFAADTQFADLLAMALGATR